MGAVVVIAFILNRSYRRQVLDIKAANGIDVTQERVRFQRTNRTIAMVYRAQMLLGLVMLILLLSVILNSEFCLFC